MYLRWNPDPSAAIQADRGFHRKLTLTAFPDSLSTWYLGLPSGGSATNLSHQTNAREQTEFDNDSLTM